MASSYSRFHLADHELLRNLTAHVARDRAATAELLADLAEVDARRLYLPAAYPSMRAYCEGELGMSPDAAAKRIQAARAAREFPALFAAIADGRLNLSGVVLLAPRLTRENGEELIAAAAGLRFEVLRAMLAARFPKPDVVASVQAVDVRTPSCQHAVQHVPATQESDSFALTAPEPVEPAPDGVAPTSAHRWSVQFTADAELHDAIQYAQALCIDDVPSSDVAGLVKLALEALIAAREKRRFGAHTRHRPARGSDDAHHVTNAVKHEVWLRDGGRCTFVSDSGRRCECRARLEFDHVEPVARGGRSTVANLRLRCTGHNQLAADRLFGRGFMDAKRSAERQPRSMRPTREGATAARGDASRPPGQRPDATPAPSGLTPAADLPATLATDARLREHEAELERIRVEQQARDAAVAEVIPVLRSLGATAEEARRLAAPCAEIPHASLQERLDLAFRGAGRFGRKAPGHASRPAA